MVGNGKKRNRKIIIERTIAKDPSMVLFDPLVHLFFPKYVPIIAAYKNKKKYMREFKNSCKSFKKDFKNHAIS